MTAAEQLTATLAPTVQTDVNPFAGRLVAVGDANITGTRFYLIADPARLPTYVYGGLDGQLGPRTKVREGFEIEGIEFKLAIDFAVGAIDFRGCVTGSGA